MSEKKLYLKLFHGRPRPNSELDDWGSNGPIFKIDSRYVHTTYATHIKFELAGQPDEAWRLCFVDDLVYYGGVYYGDCSTFMADDAELQHELAAGHWLETWDAKKAAPAPHSDELHDIIGLLNSFILENGGDDDVPFEDFTCDEARSLIQEAIETIEGHGLNSQVHAKLLQAIKIMHQQKAEMPDAPSIEDLNMAIDRLAKFMLNLPGDLYRIEFSDSQCEEIESLMDLPECWDQVGLPRKTWFQIACMALGKALLIQHGRYGPADPAEGFKPKEWRTDLREIGRTILNTFQPGDGKL